MSGATTELGLATAQDADDNADYLTIGLKQALTTVDALFNNVSGHNHSSAHQGGPVVAGGIADGSITSAKIADGTIQTTDIAANAVQQQLGAYLATPTFSTTTTSTWLATPISVNVTTAGGLLRIEGFLTLTHSAANGLALVALYRGTSAAGIFGSASSISGTPISIGFNLYEQPSAGSYTYSIYVYNAIAGTLATYNSVNSALYVTEQKR